MDKVFTFLLLSIALSAMLFLSGVTSDNETNTISMITNIMQGDIPHSLFWLTIVGILLTVSGFALVNAGTFGNASAATVVGGVSMITLVLIPIASDFIFVINKMHIGCDTALAGMCNVGYYIIWFLFVILTFGFLWSIIEFVMGGGD